MKKRKAVDVFQWWVFLGVSEESVWKYGYGWFGCVCELWKGGISGVAEGWAEGVGVVGWGVARLVGAEWHTPHVALALGVEGETVLNYKLFIWRGDDLWIEARLSEWGHWGHGVRGDFARSLLGVLKYNPVFCAHSRHVVSQVRCQVKQQEFPSRILQVTCFGCLI